MPKNRIRIMTGVAMLTAFSIILERFLPIVNTDSIRVSLGNIPIVIASIFFGPVSGVLCGVIADILGCFLNGYPPFPVLMFAPVTVGLLPGVAAMLFQGRKNFGISNFFMLSGTMLITNVIASLIITTAGLHLLYSTPIMVLFLQRIPAMLINTVVEIAVLFLLLKNRVLYRLFGIQK